MTQSLSSTSTISTSEGPNNIFENPSSIKTLMTPFDVLPSITISYPSMQPIYVNKNTEDITDKGIQKTTKSDMDIFEMLEKNLKTRLFSSTSISSFENDAGKGIRQATIDEDTVKTLKASLCTESHPLTSKSSIEDDSLLPTIKRSAPDHIGCSNTSLSTTYKKQRTCTPSTCAERNVNKKGYLRLHVICREWPDNVELVRMMIKSNPEGVSMPVVNPPESETKQEMSCSDIGSYPLHLALRNKAPLATIKLLVEYAPAVLQKKDANGRVPLSIAVANNAGNGIIQFLLSADRKSTQVADNRMNLPLHIACTRRYPLDIITALMKSYPATVNRRNFNGQNPLDLAQSLGCTDDVINYLQEVAFGELEREIEVIQ